MVTRRTVLGGTLLTAATMSACNSGNGGSSSGRYRFSYLRPTWGPATFTKGGPYQRELEKRAGVEIDVQIIPVVDYDTRVNTILASGDLPDVIWGSGPVTAIWRDAQQQGAFLQIDEYLEQYSAVRDAVPANIWDILRAEDGASYFIPNLIWPEVPFFLDYRKDLLDQAGIEEPTTTEQFVDVLGQVKQAFPDLVPFAIPDEWYTKELATSFALGKNGWEPSPDDPDTLIPWWRRSRRSTSTSGSSSCTKPSSSTRSSRSAT